VSVELATSRAEAGRTLQQVFPTAPAWPLVAPDERSFDGLDVVFLCLPHGAAATTAAQALGAGARVVDLSADFRLRDADAYQAWYGLAHPVPELLDEAVYGLTEYNRNQLCQARLVANPGCYPTSILLPLRPLLGGEWELCGPIIADSKSGVSGAGRSPSLTTHFVEVANNLSPYKVGRSHRHLPEIEQLIAAWRQPAPPLVFTPHLLPVPRGMLSTIYVTFAHPVDEAQVRQAFRAALADEPFVVLLPPGQQATLAHVCQTNRCAISLTLAGQTLVIASAIDNLVKGAAGQAVQNMNVLFGLPETLGLTW
jgi:N-acetyl-gamma-glutamyl-phosphate reductase